MIKMHIFGNISNIFSGIVKFMIILFDFYQDTIYIGDKYGEIKYYRDHNEEKIYVPFNRDKILGMKNVKCYLGFNNGDEVEITQKAGIPYLVNAENLGGDNIYAVNNLTTERRDYGKYGVPGYCEELFYTE